MSHPETVDFVLACEKWQILCITDWHKTAYKNAVALSLTLSLTLHRTAMQFFLAQFYSLSFGFVVVQRNGIRNSQNRISLFCWQRNSHSTVRHAIDTVQDFFIHFTNHLSSFSQLFFSLSRRWKEDERWKKNWKKCSKEFSPLFNEARAKRSRYRYSALCGSHQHKHF